MNDDERQPAPRQADLSGCAATTRAGVPCRAAVVSGGAYCWSHSPELADRRALARRTGGLRARGVPAPVEPPALATVGDALALLAVGAADALGAPRSLARARTLTTLALAAGKLLEVSALEARIAELEARIAARAPLGRIA